MPEDIRGKRLYLVKVTQNNSFIVANVIPLLLSQIVLVAQIINFKTHLLKLGG